MQFYINGYHHVLDRLCGSLASLSCLFMRRCFRLKTTFEGLCWCNHIMRHGCCYAVTECRVALQFDHVAQLSVYDYKYLLMNHSKAASYCRV